MLGQLAHHAAAAGVGILYIVNRIVVALRQRQVDIKDELRVGRARYQKEACGVSSDLIDQVTKGEVAARALG